MCKPLPNKHVVAEPWFRLLRTMKQPEQAPLIPRGLLSNTPASRDLASASLDVCCSRAKAATPWCNQ